MCTFVTATCARDVHYAKALLASIHYFHPHTRIMVLADCSLSGRATRALKRFPGATVLSAHELWARHKLYLTGLLTKLNLFFAEGCPQAVFCDADSVLVAPLLECIPPGASFLPFSGRPVDLNLERDRRLFYDWAFSVHEIQEIAPEFLPEYARYWMQSSHFFVDTCSFPKDEIIRFLPYLNLRHSPNGLFKAGDQGLLNFILNKHFAGRAAFRSLGNATICATNDGARDVVRICRSTGQISAAPGRRFVHFVGSSRRYHMSRHNYGELLSFFYRRFHSLTKTNIAFSEFDRALSAAARKIRSRR